MLPSAGAGLSHRVHSPYFAEGFTPIAHRGGSERWPENTREAFEGAYALGYRWIETDVHRSADGELVVFHDATLDRTTDGTGPVNARTVAELRELDAGHRFTVDGKTFPFRGRDVRILTLEEAFALAPDLRLNVEMKGDDLRLPALLHDFIDAHGVHDRVLAASANDALTARFRELNSRVPTSPGMRGILRFWMGVKTGFHARYPFQALQVPPRHGLLRVVDANFVRDAHARDLRVHVWTVNDPLEMRRLHALGVDAIMTDRPEVLLHCLSLGG